MTKENNKLCSCFFDENMFKQLDHPWNSVMFYGDLHENILNSTPLKQKWAVKRVGKT